jgi:hypothetical protein
MNSIIAKKLMALISNLDGNFKFIKLMVLNSA